MLVGWLVVVVTVCYVCGGLRETLASWLSSESKTSAAQPKSAEVEGGI